MGCLGTKGSKKKRKREEDKKVSEEKTKGQVVHSETGDGSEMEKKSKGVPFCFWGNKDKRERRKEGKN